MKAENEAHFGSSEGNQGEAVATLTACHKLILTLFGLAFFVMMYGVIPWRISGSGCPLCGGGSPR